MPSSPYPSSPPQLPVERKLKKPLMEKRRRARMNECLDQLKHLLLHIAPHQRSKLEKADILEMTVAYLHKLHNHRPAVHTNPESSTVYRQCYIDGYSVASAACVDYVRRILSDKMPHSDSLGAELVQHLQSTLCSQLGMAPHSTANQALTQLMDTNHTALCPRVRVVLPPGGVPVPLPSNVPHSPTHSQVVFPPRLFTTTGHASSESTPYTPSSSFSFSPDPSLQLSPTSSSSPISVTAISPALSMAAQQPLSSFPTDHNIDKPTLWRPF